MFGASSGVVHELWRICGMQVLDGLSLWLYVGETSSIPQSSKQRHLIIQLGRKNAWQQKAKKCLVTTYIGVELEHKRSRLRSFVSIIVLRFAFRVCIFLRFVIPSQLGHTQSHFLIFINLFCFMSVLAHSKFPQNQQSLLHNDVRN